MLNIEYKIYIHLLFIEKIACALEGPKNNANQHALLVALCSYRYAMMLCYKALYSPCSSSVISMCWAQYKFAKVLTSFSIICREGLLICVAQYHYCIYALTFILSLLIYCIMNLLSVTHPDHKWNRHKLVQTKLI